MSGVDTGPESDYEFRGYCDICSESGEWRDTEPDAGHWRALHFDIKHPDTRITDENSGIERRQESG